MQLEGDRRASLRESEAASALEVRDVEPEYGAIELPVETVEDSIIEAPPISRVGVTTVGSSHTPTRGFSRGQTRKLLAL